MCVQILICPVASHICLWSSSPFCIRIWNRSSRPGGVFQNRWRQLSIHVIVSLNVLRRVQQRGNPLALNETSHFTAVHFQPTNECSSFSPPSRCTWRPSVNATTHILVRICKFAFLRRRLRISCVNIRWLCGRLTNFLQPVCTGDWGKWVEMRFCNNVIYGWNHLRISKQGEI